MLNMASLNLKYDLKYVKLGKNIAFYRKQSGLTQVQLALKLEISREHLSHIEIGIKRPSLELLFSIAEILNIETKDLFDFSRA